ncbi:MAG TPA: hypothetical protein VEX38_03060 [Fimbriimonadaceae bacterium]|nr:hypothetical protein [Fimbriimonadaceae bacterium]
MSDKTYLQHQKDDLRNWRTQLDELKVQASLAKAEVQQELQPQIDRMQIMVEHLEKQLSDFGEASEDALKDIRSGVQMAIQDLSLGFRSAVDRLKS